MDFGDISSFQAGADLGAYATAGHDRLLVKATEGTGYTNPWFAVWWAAAGRLGLARGAYHYAMPSRSAGPAEADHFAAVVQAAGGLGPRDWVCLDAEDPDERGNHAALHARDFCARLAGAHGLPAGVIYGGAWYLGPAGLTPSLLPADWRRLHIADYSARADGAVPVPPGWHPEQIVARQYTSTARQPGIPGPSDRSRVLREWLPATTTPTPPPEDDMPSPSEWTKADWDAVTKAVGPAVADYLSAEMRQLVTTDPDTGLPVRMADVRLGSLGEALGLLVLRSSFGMRRDGELAEAVQDIGQALAADTPTPNPEEQS